MSDLHFTPPVEDRRRISVRIVSLQVAAGVVFTALAASFW
jgi:hypothetical protein